MDGTPPLKAKSVENGKSGSGFLVPGAAHVDPDAGSSYSAIFKQVNAEEAKLLPSIYPELVAHYSRRGGSLLTPGHRDNGSALTLSVLLSDPAAAHCGGAFVTYCEGVPVVHDELRRGVAELRRGQLH